MPQESSYPQLLATLWGSTSWGVSVCAGGQLQLSVQPQVSRPGGLTMQVRLEVAWGHSPGSLFCSMPQLQVSGDLVISLQQLQSAGHLVLQEALVNENL